MYLETKKVLQTTELQRSFNWEVILPDISNITGISISPFITDVNFSNYNMNDIYTLKHGSFESHSAGFFTIPNVSITILCPTNNSVTNYFQEWRKLITNDNGYFYAKENYAKTMYAYLFSRAGEKVDGFKLINVFPKTFPSFNLNYEANEFLKFKIELSVDKIERA